MNLTPYPSILLIGGASRNVGKTSLTCKIIAHFAQEKEIIGLKIKTIRAGDEKKHGKGRHELTSDFLVAEESYTHAEDTGKMFEAGAKRVFHIKTWAHALPEALAEFFNAVGEDKTIICESNSLRKIIKPGLFLMIKSKAKPHDIKPSAQQLQAFADRIIWTDGSTHDFQPSDLVLASDSWALACKTVPQ